MEQSSIILVVVGVAVALVAQSFFATPAKQLEDSSSSTKSMATSSSSSNAAKKKKKKAKKKKAAKKEPEPEPEPQPEPEAEPTPTPAPSKKKKKKKKKAPSAAPAAAPVPVKKEEPVPEPKKEEPAPVLTDDDDDDQEDDDDDVSRLLNATQLSKAQKKKKKKKKKKAAAAAAEEKNEQDEGSWVVVNKHHSSSNNNNNNASAAPDSDDKRTEIIPFEAKNKPILVGPKGATIQWITETSGARLDIDLPVLKITGTEFAIAAAKDMVDVLLSDHKAKSAFSITLSGKDIKSSDGIKAIVGKGGSNIKQIQLTTGCKLDANIDAGKVVITGPSEDQIQQAATLCRHSVFGEHQVVVDLKDKSRVMVIFGQNYQKIRQFQDDSGGAKLDIAKGTTTLKISGPTGAVNKARDMVTAWLNHCAGITLNIPQSAPGSFDKVGAIYGKGGSTIRAIQDKTGAFINVDDKEGKVQISGVPGAVQEALKMVQQAMEDGCLMEEGEVKDSIVIPRNAGPTVIGKGGANIKLLEKTHSVKVRLSGQSCVLIGKPPAVARCKTEVSETIQPFIEEERIQQEAERLAAEQEASAGGGPWSAGLQDDLADGW